MSKRCIVWMDHEKAHVLGLREEHTDGVVVRAQRHEGHAHGAQNKHHGDSNPYFRDVIGAVNCFDEILVVGPSSAKLEFLRFVREHDKPLERRVVGLETVDHPTDGQLVAYGKKYFEHLHVARTVLKPATL
jgi:stalled ribosome rescue protein Dom34